MSGFESLIGSYVSSRSCLKNELALPIFINMLSEVSVIENFYVFVDQIHARIFALPLVSSVGSTKLIYKLYSINFGVTLF